MSKQSNEELINLIQAGIDIQENYEKLYKQNRGFIYLIIRKRIHGIYEEEDLMQQAFFALVKAVNYYKSDLEKTSFLQILKYCIWNEIRNNSSELPVNMQYKILDYRRAYDRLYDELGYKPKAHQVMYEMGISLNELDEIRAAMRTTVSLDEPINEEEDVTRLDLYSENQVDEDVDFDRSLENEDLRNLIQEALNRLPDNDREIINKRFYKSWTLKKMGEELNVTPERVRQLEVKALRKLRRDRQLEKQLEGYINVYKHIGVESFNRNWTSSTEWLVLERERRLAEWKQQHGRN